MTNLNSKELLGGVTPGPWEVVRNEDFGGEDYFVIAHPGGIATIIADLNPPGRSALEEEANARLIASAPRLARRVIELEEALKPFAAKADYCDALELADDDYADCAPMKAGDYRRARAALTIQGEAK